MIHHTDTPAETESGKPYPEFDKQMCDKMARDRGWDECGYNWLIGRDGVVYEGRELGKQGAHCPSMNRTAIGVAFVLRGTEESPTPQAIEAMRALKAQMESLYGKLELTFHREHRATVCPGDRVVEVLNRG